MELKNNIINKFKNRSFYEKYNSDIWVTIVLIIFVTFLSFYFLVNGFIKSKKASWLQNKCNPLYMPFARVINEDDYNENEDLVAKNFDECLNKLAFDMGMENKGPMDALFSFFMSMFGIASKIIGQIMSFFMYLLNFMLGLFNIIIGAIKELIKKTEVIFSRIAAVVNYVLDFLDIIKYTIKNILDFVRYTFFLIATSFSTAFVVPSIVTSILLNILAVISFLIAIAFAWVIGLGSFFMSVAITTKILAVLSLIIMIFFIMLSINLNKGIKDAICSSTIFDSESAGFC